MNINIFKKVADLALGAKRREDAEYADFLKFYRDLVEVLPTEVVELFDGCPRAVISKGAEYKWIIQLTATDFIWWKTKIEQEGARFKNGVTNAKLAMLEKLAKSAEAKSLTPEERKTLLAMLDEGAGTP